MITWQDLSSDERIFIAAVRQLNGAGLAILADWYERNGMEQMAPPLRRVAHNRKLEEEGMDDASPVLVRPARCGLEDLA